MSPFCFESEIVIGLTPRESPKLSRIELELRARVEYSTARRGMREYRPHLVFDKFQIVRDVNSRTHVCALPPSINTITIQVLRM